MEVKLTDEEVLFSLELQKQFAEVFIPVPFFIWRIGRINTINIQRLMSVVKSMKEDEEFQNISGIRPERLSFILLNAAEFAVWKRSILMRIQLVMQLIALFFLIKVILCLF